jgi:hypothetical protein
MAVISLRSKSDSSIIPSLLRDSGEIQLVDGRGIFIQTNAAGMIEAQSDKV